jgi:hypothetical protein
MFQFEMKCWSVRKFLLFNLKICAYLQNISRRQTSTLASMCDDRDVKMTLAIAFYVIRKTLCPIIQRPLPCNTAKRHEPSKMKMRRSGWEIEIINYSSMQFTKFIYICVCHKWNQICVMTPSCHTTAIH